MHDSLLRDIRFAGRWLRRSPGFALVAVASLTIGIGFNTALFSVVDTVLFRPLPVGNVDRLVDVYLAGGRAGERYATSSCPDFFDLKAQNGVFEDMLGFSPMFATQNLGDRSRLVFGEVVSGNYFRMLGIAAEVGHTLLPDDDRLGAERVVMVSDHYWRREFGGDPSAIGRTITLRDQSYTIVGVVPPAFTGMVPILAPEIWVPMAQVNEIDPAGMQHTVPSPTGTNRLDRRGQRWMFIKGRLRPDTTIDQARANLDLLMGRLATEYPQTNKDWHISLVATRDVRNHPEATAFLAAASAGLMLVVGLGLLIRSPNGALRRPSEQTVLGAGARPRSFGAGGRVGRPRGATPLLDQLQCVNRVHPGCSAIWR